MRFYANSVRPRVRYNTKLAKRLPDEGTKQSAMGHFRNLNSSELNASQGYQTG